MTQEEYLSIVKKNHSLTLIKNFLEGSLNRKTKGKMFNIVTGTWNPISGCLYNCVYCWARSLALTKLQNVKRYSKGFKPSLNGTEFCSRFSKGDLIFVSDMGDMFADFIPDDWVKKVLNHIGKFPEADFLLMTKNPKRYLQLLPFIPKNAILGATIETTDDELYITDKVSVAPPPSQRYKAMAELDWERKIISIEPILDFNQGTMVNWIKEINPFIVYVGYDNYNHGLREPTLKQTTELLQSLSDYSLVIRKSIRPAWFENQGIRGMNNEQQT